MRFDFDTPVERSGTWSTRWDRYAGRAGREILPLWVADMDFRAPPAILDAFAARVEHGVFGYSTLPDALREAIVQRLERLYGWRIEPGWIVMLPGVVPGLHLAVRMLTSPHHRVLLPTPVYNHFKRAAELAPRKFEEIPLAQSGGHWVLDRDRLEDAMRHGARLLLLCNPQNPGGSIYTRAELERIAGLAERYDVLVCSDEIHADILLEAGRRHVPIAGLGREMGRRTVTLMSPNKTFNIPGAGCAYAVIEDAQLRALFSAELHALVPEPGVFGYAGALAAYADPTSEVWLAELLAYLRANRALLEQAMASIPGLRHWHVEATCLAWIDAGEWGVQDPSAYLLKHGLALSPGAQFGAPGFVRLNFGTQRARLGEAMARIRAAAAAL